MAKLVEVWLVYEKEDGSRFFRSSSFHGSDRVPIEYEEEEKPKPVERKSTDPNIAAHLKLQPGANPDQFVYGTAGFIKYAGQLGVRVTGTELTMLKRREKIKETCILKSRAGTHVYSKADVATALEYL